MKRRWSIFLAAISLWPAVVVAASRPHYGGTLRIAIKEVPASLDPATSGGGEPGSLSSLVFETLTSLDDQGHPQPLLAASWQAEPGNQRWRFILRSGVSFSDGAALEANTVAASLRAANADWKVLANGDSVMIETASPLAELPSELALARNAIVHRNDFKLSGTGPFAIAEWVSGKHLTLKANDRYWNGRPFLDSVEIEFGKSYREQLGLLELGKADVIEVAPENIHRAEGEGRTVISSEPSTLMALVFAAPPKSDDEAHARTALAMSIDTAAISNVVLQGGGEPTGALLPNWLSGYGFVFPSGKNADAARQARTLARRTMAWTLGYDASDPISHVIAERIQLNAKDMGLTVQLAISGASDMRLVRLSLPSLDPELALDEIAAALQLPKPKAFGASTEGLYAAERTLLETYQVVPLLHVRSAVAVRSNVHDWKSSALGAWRIENAWVGTEKP